MEGSAVKADAIANVPSRPTASRCFAIAGQVRGTENVGGCRLYNVIKQDAPEEGKEERIFQALGMHFSVFWVLGL
jgi:hypothetical protein